jgi:hypothetical protein
MNEVVISGFNSLCVCVCVCVCVILQNNLGGYAFHLLVVHVRPANQRTITGVALCQKWFEAPGLMRYDSLAVSCTCFSFGR